MEMINDPLTIAVPEKNCYKSHTNCQYHAMILDQIKEKDNLNQILYGEIVYTHSQSLPPSESELSSYFKLLEAFFYALLVPGLQTLSSALGFVQSKRT